jgi:nucleotide-binding universal stress UspA family protein
MASDRLSAPKKILAAVDGSEDGYRAAEYAIELAAKLQSTILFLYVAGASSAEPSYSITADMAGSFERMGNEALSKCSEDAKKKGVTFETLLVPGDPVDEILKAAKKTNCDSIVVGKRGLSKMEKLLMGSVSDRVSKLSDIPVTVVK